MKKKILSAVLALCLAFGSAAALPQSSVVESTSITASAEGETKKSGNYEYKILKNGTAEITKYNGKETKVTIPSKLGGKKVTSIGHIAFSFCTTITSVTIPDSVTSIGDYAFQGCVKLTSITIPNSVKSIGYCAFGYCTSLTSVTVPSSVTSIGDSAFSGCRSLTSVTIPGSVNSIEKWFSGCTSLKSVTIQNGVKSIGNSAFSNCQNLSSVTIPSSVTSIGDYAFSLCTNLTSVTIPSSVKSIGSYAFSGTKWLENKQKQNTLVIVNGILIDGTKCKGKVTIPSSVKSIGALAFGFCKSLTSVTIPSSVKSICSLAFYYCRTLKSVTIPSSVTSIGNNAFYVCTSLKSVIIPKSVKTIGAYAFGYYYNSKTPVCDRIAGFTISGVKGTAAEKYAKKNGFKFVARNTTEPKTVRYAGSDRADTAARISKAVNAKTSDTVILATGFDFHDALAAVPLASAYNAPLLLADRDNLSAKALTEIKRLKAKNVIVVASTNAKDQNGKSAAIKSKVYKQLKGYNVTKLVGSSYYETAKKVAQQLQKKTGKAPNYVFFTTNRNYADALSVSPVAAILKAPILYVDPKCRLNANTTYYLNSVKSSVKKVFIIGGTNAVSKDVVAKIKAVLPGKTVQRFAGADRYATCVRINNAFKSTLTGDSVCVAKGYNFPDALAGGVFAAKQKASLFLADVLGGKAELSKTQSSYLKSKNPSKLYIFGGETAVPTALVKTAAKACV